MMIFQKTFVYVFIVLLSCSFASAAFSVEIDALNNTVLPFESATYLLKIYAESEDVININTNANNWIVTPQTIVHPGDGLLTRELLITPRSGTGLSNYRVPLVFSSARTNFEFPTSVFLSISFDLLTHGYPVNVHANVTAPSKIDPREDFVIKFLLRNNNLRNIEEIKVFVQSDLFETSFSTPLEPLSVVRQELAFELDPLQAPGRHSLYVRISSGDTTILEENRFYEVSGYSRVSSSRITSPYTFFRRTENITLFNNGNDMRSSTISFDTTWFESLFSKTHPQGELLVDEGTRKYTWTTTLSAQESTSIIVVVDYRPLVYAIIAIIVIILLYFIIRSPIIVMKETRIIKSEEAGSSEMKVRIYVKNRSRSVVSNLKIIDRVPRIAQLIKHAHLGTLQPTKIAKSEKKGTIIRWEVDALEPYEERIISYKIRSKLNIVGNMSLPEAKVNFETIGGSTRVSRSGPSQPARQT